MAKHTAKAAVTIPDDKVRAAREAVEQIDRQFGKGTIVRMGTRIHTNHPCLPTGVYQLDEYVIQAGGIPEGRITEVYGPESGGKTTLALTTIAQAQRRGGICGFVDVEHALDPAWASKLGVDVEALYVTQPDTGEQALEITETMVRSGGFALVVVDSVAALVPQAEINGEMGDSHMGLQARLMSQALRKLTGAANKTKTAILFINQIREKIGVMFGSPETTTGGRALKFYASLRLDIRRIGQVKDGESIVGNKVKIKAAKNKLGAPFRDVEVDLLFNRGLDGVGSVLDAAVLNGTVQQSGSWFSYAGERIGQGRAKVIDGMRENQALYEAIYAETKKKDSEGIAA